MNSHRPAVIGVIFELLTSRLAVAQDEDTTSRLGHEQIVKKVLLLVAFEKDDGICHLTSTIYAMAERAADLIKRRWN
jgi:hypothetical protein